TRRPVSPERVAGNAAPLVRHGAVSVRQRGTAQSGRTRRRSQDQGGRGRRAPPARESGGGLWNRGKGACRRGISSRELSGRRAVGWRPRPLVVERSRAATGSHAAVRVQAQ